MRSMKALILALVAVFLANAAIAQSTYRISPGDVLSVEVLQDPSLNRELLVLPDGSISFPFAGTLRAGGRTIPEVQSAIADGIASNFAVAPNVFVTVRQSQPRAAVATGPVAPATIEVYFLGEVNQPGARDMPTGTTLLQALARSGGFTNFAALKRLQLRRTDPTTGQQSISLIDYRALADGARLSKDIVMADGDVILVPERKLFE